MKLTKILKDWKSYAYYLLATIVLTGAFHLMKIHTFHTSNFLPNLNFLILFLVIFVVGTIGQMMLD